MTPLSRRDRAALVLAPLWESVPRCGAVTPTIGRIAR
jgi:hypothetical protein